MSEVNFGVQLPISANKEERPCFIASEWSPKWLNNTAVWGWELETWGDSCYYTTTLTQQGPCPAHSRPPPTSILLSPFRTPLTLSTCPCGTCWSLRRPLCGPLSPHPLHSFSFSAYTFAKMPLVPVMVRISHQQEVVPSYPQWQPSRVLRDRSNRGSHQEEKELPFLVLVIHWVLINVTKPHVAATMDTPKCLFPRTWYSDGKLETK